MSWYRPVDGGVQIAIRVQPRASRSALEGVANGRLRLRLQAPPVDNAANEAAIAYMAECLGLARRAVKLVAGHKAREKTLLVEGDQATLLSRLAALET